MALIPSPNQSETGAANSSNLNRAPNWARPASLGNLPPRHRLQISDGGEHKALCPSQVRNLVPQSGMGGADRWREARFRAERIATDDEGERS